MEEGLDTYFSVEFVDSLVHALQHCVDDSRVAYGIETHIHAEVLRAIAEGRCENAAECARIAMSTSELPFQRTCSRVDHEQLYVDPVAAERDRFETAMSDSEWNVSLAARRLKIPRTTLYRRLRDYGIRRP